MAKILIIDDDPQICNMLVQTFTRMNHRVDYNLTLEQGMEKIFFHEFDVVFLDVILPDGNGLKAIKQIQGHPSAPEIIIMTGAIDPEGAELAIKSKAWDYIQKSRSCKEFEFSLHRALVYRKQELLNKHETAMNRKGIIGESTLISQCLDKVLTFAENEYPVMITGETGTGKELFSKAVHNNSQRSNEQFVVVDCTVLPEHLVESTLFGHVKGTFTGAESNKTGLMKMADKGTLFLDEVGELPLSVQSRFLRAVQEKSFRPVGGRKEVQSDFRLISATNRNLKEMVKKKQFRKDLFYRIFSANIHLPPLKDREDDIKIIAMHHLFDKKGDARGNPCIMSQKFLKEIQMYDWPGNVRELMNTLTIACSDAGSGNTLFPYHLPDHIRAFNIKNKFIALDHDNISEKKIFSGKKKECQLKFKDHIEKTKYEYLHDLLSFVNRDFKKACKVSGLSRSQLYRLVRQYNLKTTISD
jgi:two-component system, NtrC family, response regulator